MPNPRTASRNLGRALAALSLAVMSAAPTRGDDDPQSVDDLVVCEDYAAAPACAFRTWIACRYIKTSPCARIGNPIRKNDIPEEPHEMYRETIESNPEMRDIYTRSTTEPWTLKANQLFSFITYDSSSDFGIVGIAPVKSDRMGAGRALPQELEGAIEYMVILDQMQFATNISVFVKQENSRWRVVGWHRAENQFGATGFDQVIDPSQAKWIEDCTRDERRCVDSGFVFGLPPYEVYTAQPI
ncbi:MAG: hypothetical protein SFV21_18185 [Rhodospirillaceae bacterium]|nr:hypothetical protein [Rhodospirillaceae bacterium]